jgi:hypothetical protein
MNVETVVLMTLAVMTAVTAVSLKISLIICGIWSALKRELSVMMSTAKVLLKNNGPLESSADAKVIRERKSAEEQSTKETNQKTADSKTENTSWFISAVFKAILATVHRIAVDSEITWNGSNSVISVQENTVKGEEYVWRRSPSSKDRKSMIGSILENLCCYSTLILEYWMESPVFSLHASITAGNKFANMSRVIEDSLLDCDPTQRWTVTGGNYSSYLDLACRTIFIVVEFIRVIIGSSVLDPPLLAITLIAQVIGLAGLSLKDEPPATVRIGLNIEEDNEMRERASCSLHKMSYKNGPIAVYEAMDEGDAVIIYIQQWLWQTMDDDLVVENETTRLTMRMGAEVDNQGFCRPSLWTLSELNVCTNTVELVFEIEKISTFENEVRLTTKNGRNELFKAMEQVHSKYDNMSEYCDHKRMRAQYNETKIISVTWGKDMIVGWLSNIQKSIFGNRNFVMAIIAVLYAIAAAFMYLAMTKMLTTACCMSGIAANMLASFIPFWFIYSISVWSTMAAPNRQAMLTISSRAQGDKWSYVITKYAAFAAWLLAICWSGILLFHATGAMLIAGVAALPATLLTATAVLPAIHGLTPSEIHPIELDGRNEDTVSLNKVWYDVSIKWAVNNYNQGKNSVDEEGNSRIAGIEYGVRMLDDPYSVNDDEFAKNLTGQLMLTVEEMIARQGQTSDQVTDRETPSVLAAAINLDGPAFNIESFYLIWATAIARARNKALVDHGELGIRYDSVERWRSNHARDKMKVLPSVVVPHGLLSTCSGDSDKSLADYISKRNSEFATSSKTTEAEDAASSRRSRAKTPLALEDFNIIQVESGKNDGVHTSVNREDDRK